MKLSIRKAGFTMLELLAVLAIVLILGAILFPAIESAREKSLATACSQNVKQLVLAVIQYEQDKGQYPPGRQFYNTGAPGAGATNCVRWYNAIANYMHASDKATSAMGNTNFATLPGSLLAGLAPGEQAGGTATEIYPASYRCPQVGDGWDVASQNMSYGYNFQYLGNADPLSIINAGATGFVNFPVSRGTIKRPDRTICIADSDGTGAGGYRSASGFDPGATTASDSIGAFGYLIDPTFLPARDLDKDGTMPDGGTDPAPSLDIPPAAGGLYVDTSGNLVEHTGGSSIQRRRSVISDRHKGAANVAYLDGHVEFQDRGAVYFAQSTPSTTDINIYPSNWLFNGEGQDNDLDGNGNVDGATGDRLVDPNECYVTTAAAPPLVPSGQVAYNGAQGTGFSKFHGLTGAYAGFGPGFDGSALGFLNEPDGPTLPKKAPFELPLGGSASVQ